MYQYIISAVVLKNVPVYIFISIIASHCKKEGGAGPTRMQS